MESIGPLNAFIQAAENGSFTAAGRQLGISSSAVGKAIARLEQRLGVRLLHRSTRSITLTPEGALYLERCRRIFGELAAAEQELQQTRQGPHGRLRISLPQAGMLMMPTLSAFIRAYPDIELDLHFSDWVVDVIAEGYDAVVRTGEASDSRLMTRKLGTFHPLLVASPDYLAAAGTPLRVAELLEHRCLQHKFPTTGKLEPWPFSGDLTPPALPTSAISSSVEALIVMAQDGLGIACLPDFAVRRHVCEGSLVEVLAGSLENCGVFRVLWPSSRYLSPKIRVFVDFMVQHLFPDAPDGTPGRERR